MQYFPPGSNRRPTALNLGPARVAPLSQPSERWWRPLVFGSLLKERSRHRNPTLETNETFHLVQPWLRRATPFFSHETLSVPPTGAKSLMPTDTFMWQPHVPLLRHLVVSSQICRHFTSDVTSVFHGRVNTASVFVLIRPSRWAHLWFLRAIFRFPVNMTLLFHET